MCYYIACHKSQNRLEPVRVEFGEKGETRAVVVESCLVFLSSNSLLQGGKATELESACEVTKELCDMGWVLQRPRGEDRGFRRG